MIHRVSEKDTHCRVDNTIAATQSKEEMTSCHDWLTRGLMPFHTRSASAESSTKAGMTSRGLQKATLSCKGPLRSAVYRTRCTTSLFTWPIRAAELLRRLAVAMKMLPTTLSVVMMRNPLTHSTASTMTHTSHTQTPVCILKLCMASAQVGAMYVIQRMPTLKQPL